MNILYDERLDGPLPRVDKRALIEELRQTLPDMTLLHEREDLQPFECDGLAAYRILPMLAVIPDSVDQVQAFMRICHRRKVPVVARGAGAGLSGGALPLEGGALLVLTRLNTILEVSPEGRFARMQPGVRNLAISEAAAPYHLYYAPDPSSQIACSIGGNVAENAGGVHCLKYGLTVHNLLKLEIITPVKTSQRSAFHCPCTLQHAQKLGGRVEVDGHPVLARQLRDKRMNALEAGKPDTIVTANIGCQTHLGSAARTPVRHWIEVVEDAFEPRRCANFR